MCMLKAADFVFQIRLKGRYWKKWISIDGMHTLQVRGIATWERIRLLSEEPQVIAEWFWMQSRNLDIIPFISQIYMTKLVGYLMQRKRIHRTMR